MLLGDNGIIQRAKDSKDQTLIAQYREKIDLIKEETRIKNEGNITLSNLNDAFNTVVNNDWVNNTEITDSKIKLITNDGYVFFITENTTEYKGPGDVIIPEIIMADDVQFTPTDTNWKAIDGSDITNVKQALDYLYDINR